MFIPHVKRAWLFMCAVNIRYYVVYRRASDFIHVKAKFTQIIFPKDALFLKHSSQCFNFVISCRSCGKKSILISSDC